MDTRTRSASPSHDLPIKLEDSPPFQDKISAYYSLVFPHFTFYIQTLSITIGRRCASTPHTGTSSTPEPLQVDVDLGALKSVSRLHAKIEYDQEEDRFVLAVIGRNGAWVDGVWSGAGTRAPLSERSQIQIASRTFQFVLPPPAPPEDTPSPSSHTSSTHRARSPSVDVTSISPPSSLPPHSPIPPTEAKLPPPPPPPPSRPPQQLPNSNAIGKGKATSSKKRKKGDIAAAAPVERPKPEDMPPKPQFTYAQLIFRAIKAIGGKATLQEICAWIMNTHEYYKYADGAWMSSVRHNLSSGRAFLKMERCGGDRGKGFFWTIDEKFAHSLEEQETKSQQQAAAAAQGASSSGKDGVAKNGRKKDRGASLLEPPLKRSVKDMRGGPLPPPLTSAPLPVKATTTPAVTINSKGITTTSPATTGVFAYPAHPHHAHMVTPSTMTSGYSAIPMSTPNPYAVLTQSHWGMQPTTGSTNFQSPTVSKPPPAIVPSTSTQTQPNTAPGQQAVAAVAKAPAVPDVFIPIVLGPIPPSHPDYAPSHPNNSAKEGYMILHERKLILDPDVFAGLTKEMLEELEKMGARSALVVLTGHMVRALKERRAKGRGKERGARKARPKGPSKKAPPPGGPFTNAPLADRRGGEAPVGGSGMEVKSAAVDTGDPGTPIVVVDDSEDDGPATKRRKLEVEGVVSV